VLLPDTGLSDAMIVAEKVRKLLMKRRIVRKDAGADYGTITVSLGVSQYRYGEPLADFVHRADSALYFAKAHGRNRVDSEEEVIDRVA